MHRTEDGAVLPYALAGRGVPLVFVHGFGLDRAFWDAQAAALAAQYRVLCYDLRGFGAASLPTAPYSHARDLRSLLDALALGPAHVVGLSMGGRVALRLALDAPQSVRSLTLVDSVLDGFRMSEAWLARWREVVALARGGDVEAARRRWLEHELFAPARANPLAAAALERIVMRYSGWHWRERDPEEAGSPPALEALKDIPAPTQVLLGEKDLPDFHAIAARLKQDLPRATLAILPGVGHLPNLEGPAAFNAALLAHLAAN
jgi:pimeloyl-ACP methyl ester carboxylesterase